jgi:hypothetical protein
MQMTIGKLWLAAFVPVLAATAPAATWSNIAVYPVPTSQSDPVGIAAGPDGALWFTESLGNKIGSITTGGAIAEYAVPTADSAVQGITAGPGGALWFTESSADNIGRITTTGVVTEYPVPTAFSQPYGIAAGPDGALWFTESAGNNIARAPACGLGLSASFANGTVTLNFSLGTSTPATWFGNLLTSTGGERQLWFKSIPAVVPPDSFTVTLGPGFPNLGDVTIVSGLETAPGEGLCYETAGVDSAQ